MSDHEETSSMSIDLYYLIRIPSTGKRCRVRGRSISASTTLKYAIALTCIAAASCFSPNSSDRRSRIEMKIGARKKLDDVFVHQVQPRSVSLKERERAVEALAQQQEHDAAVVKSHVLEMLSDSFLYPSSRLPSSRPRGRPEMVPGAMTYETMLHYRQRAKALQDGKISVAAYVNDFSETQQNADSWIDQASTVAEPSPTPRRGRGRPKKLEKGASRKIAASVESKPSPKMSAEPSKTRKRVVKSLPKARDREDEQQVTDESVTFISSKRRKTSIASDLQKYYRTDLLTAKEEYSLGLLVQLMVKCESVHEGLALRLERMPSIVEWAHSCGFTCDDKSFFDREAYSELRPLGCDDMFEIKDPNMFVGNGLASEMGVGRGRGRAKKSPLERLPVFYDDTENKFRPPGTPRIRPVLMNTGTPTDFVELLMDAKDAKQRMVSSNMRLVLSISRKYANVGVNLQDLVQEGSLGLSRAAEKFEPKKGFKFSTYASWWIQQAVFRSIAYHSRTIRLPVHVHNLLNRIRKIRKNLEQELGRPPTNDEMAKHMDMSVSKYNKMMRLTRRSISLETPKYKQNPKDYGHEGSDLLRDTIDSAQVLPDECTPEKGVDRSLLHDDLKEMLNVLEDDERRVITARYGLEDGLSRTVTAVAAQLKMPKAWVRSKECRALRKLRRPWYEKRLKEHQNSLTG